MTDTSTELNQLYSEARKHPEDDTLRLVIADRLDYNGYSPVAEMIRVQVELASLLAGEFLLLPETPKGAYYYALQARESALLRDHPDLFRAKCVACDGSGRATLSTATPSEQHWGMLQCDFCKREKYVGTPDRGFLTTVPVRTLADVMETPSHGYDRKGSDCGVDWSGRNGFPCCCAWSSDIHGDECPEHGKIGVPVPMRLTSYARYLLSLSATHPLLSGVEVGDKSPDRSSISKGKFLWFEGIENEGPFVPRAIFERLPGDSIPQGNPNRSHKQYDSEPLARSALASAVYDEMLDVHNRSAAK